MLHLETEGDVRVASTVLGAATALFGLWPVLAPRSFARAFGLSTQGGPTSELAIRSTGVRDLVMGAGLVSAAVHGGRIGPWLLARLLVDGLDGAAVSLALANRQGRNRQLALLGLLAAGAALVDAALWWAAKVIADPAPLDEF
jgi:hypothetical protein